MSESRFTATLESQHPDAVLALILELMWIRSVYRVGRALETRYPTEAEWLAALNSSDFLELVDEFALVLRDIRVTLQFGPAMTPEDVQRAVETHYERALRAVGEFAQHLGVEGEEILSALIQSQGRYERHQGES